MSWQPIDFQGITSLDTSLVDLLHQYLDEKEAELSKAILEAIPPDLRTPILPYSFTNPVKLSEAIEVFSKKCSQSLDSLPHPISDLDWQPPVKAINQALWKYVEVLEGCATELFQQLDLIGLEQWHSRLPHVVGMIKELLLHRMEEAIWGTKRLEDHLWKYRLNCESHLQRPIFFQKLTRYWTALLDRNLLQNLDKSQAFVRGHYYRFLKRYGGYVQLQEKVELSLEKFSAFPVMPLLEKETQKQFKKLYQLLRLWEMNRTAKAVPPRELVIAIRHALSIEKATGLFREYFEVVKAHLFNLSRLFKQRGTSLLIDSPANAALQLDITNCQAEIHMLGATIAHYRDFLLRADPDPYVRSRLGFSEWIVGPEPAQTKPLLDLGYEVETLNDLCTGLGTALQKEESEVQHISIDQVDPDIQQALHEMGNPLATHRMMKTKVEAVLEKLSKLNEWEAFSMDVVEYVGKTFSMLLRRDWKFQAAHEFNLFQQLYSIHQGLVKPVEDRNHITRMHKFTTLLHQIQNWVTKYRTQHHFHDIELDMNDIKGYLQDFLGYVQRSAQDKDLSAEKAQKLKADIAQELLEYRYLFSTFFYQLRQNEVEGQLIRRQFLFVDQYFDSIEQRLNEFKITDPAPAPPTQDNEEED